MYPDFSVRAIERTNYVSFPTWLGHLSWCLFAPHPESPGAQRTDSASSNSNSNISQKKMFSIWEKGDVTGMSSLTPNIRTWRGFQQGIWHIFIKYYITITIEIWVTSRNERLGLRLGGLLKHGVVVHHFITVTTTNCALLVLLYFAVDKQEKICRFAEMTAPFPPSI